MGGESIPERSGPRPGAEQNGGAATSPPAYAGPVDGTTAAPGVEPAGGTTLAPARPDPDLDDGDHDRMAHIVLEGYTPKGGEFVSTGPSVVEGMVNQTAVRALCGKEWVPGRNPARYGLCPTCKEIAEGMGWKIPSG